MGKFLTISRTYRNPPSSKPWAIAQAFWSKSVDFRPFGLLSKSLRISSTTVRNPFVSTQEKFQTISRTYRNPPSSKPWAIAQAFWSKSVDFRPFGILSKSLRISSKTVRNPFASTQETFREVSNDFSHLPKSALFKTMGYSPGFLVKIGRFQTLGNSFEIFKNKLQNS